MKRLLLLLPLLLMSSLAMAAELDAEGKKLYQQLLEAADARDCETVIISGYQFKQGYSAYLETHPDASAKTDASIGVCIDAMSAQEIPVKPASSIGLSDPGGS